MGQNQNGSPTKSFNYHDLKTMKEQFQVFDQIKLKREGPQTQKVAARPILEPKKVIALRAVLMRCAVEGLESEIKSKNSFCTHVEENSTDSEDERFCAKKQKRMPYDDIVRKAAQDVMYKKMFAKKQGSGQQIPLRKPSNVQELEK